MARYLKAAPLNQHNTLGTKNHHDLNHLVLGIHIS